MTDTKISKWREHVDSLLELDAKGALAPHGIGGLARELFLEAKALLASCNQTGPMTDLPQQVLLAVLNVPHVIESDQIVLRTAPDRAGNATAQLHERVAAALRAASIPTQPEGVKPSPLSYFTDNVDAWGSAQWFDRLATAIRDHDAAVVAGEEIKAETCRMIASSSAMRLVRDFEKEVRSALTPASTNGGGVFDMLAHLARQRDWSGKTFGPGPRTAGVIDHIRKELREIEADPADISEWIDVVILALDGAWRAGYEPQQIIDALADKQAKNENRNWPDWRTMPADKAIEHDRTGEAASPPTVPGAVMAWRDAKSMPQTGHGGPFLVYWPPAEISGHGGLYGGWSVAWYEPSDGDGWHLRFQNQWVRRDNITHWAALTIPGAEPTAVLSPAAHADGTVDVYGGTQWTEEQRAGSQDQLAASREINRVLSASLDRLAPNELWWAGIKVEPMNTAPSGPEAMEPAEIETHDGSWAVILDADHKPIGWFDTHAAFTAPRHRRGPA